MEVHAAIYLFYKEISIKCCYLLVSLKSNNIQLYGNKVKIPKNKSSLVFVGKRINVHIHEPQP